MFHYLRQVVLNLKIWCILCIDGLFNDTVSSLDVLRRMIG
jgi:hypothetical protein